ncbi:twin-arginine translocation signal domain-containing protein [Brachybacterium sp. AOP42-C2-15]|uniref:twin-arginine translocation signal domain-containing protein n=1 Tax=unclassified Brachybacterium TaxID=2623841 RepID=UPI003FB8A8B7
MRTIKPASSSQQTGDTVPVSRRRFLRLTAVITAAGLLTTACSPQNTEDPRWTVARFSPRPASRARRSRPRSQSSI